MIGRAKSMSDLPRRNLEKIRRVLARHPQVREAVLYGSWAQGTPKFGSDIDIALKGSELNLQILNRISRDLDDQLIPNAIDLCIYDRINDPDVLDHIQRVGKTIYSRT